MVNTGLQFFAMAYKKLPHLKTISTNQNLSNIRTSTV
uniref:Uncharacterized protein n=1 Tax=Arundo donax TaxID=35708 RepID=A0A0A9A503_ARUDO